MHVRVVELAEEQDGLVSWWQLRERGLTEHAIVNAATDLRQLHDGVWLTGHLPPSASAGGRRR